VNVKLRQIEVYSKTASFVDTANGWVYGIQYAFMKSHITAVMRLSEFDVVISFIERLIYLSYYEQILFFSRIGEG
jgi:spore maturation protein CgeB